MKKFLRYSLLLTVLVLTLASCEKDDTDMMLAVKEGLAAGQRVFHLYGGRGG